MVSQPELPIRKHIARLALGLAAILVIVALAGEVALRVGTYDPFHSIAPRFLWERDAELGVVLRPGFEGPFRQPEFDVTVAIDEHGIRDSPSLPAESVVFALGDSFTFGFGVEVSDAFPAVLEELLGRPERSVEVLNLGAPGVGTGHMSTILERTLEWVRPDLILVTFFFNDLRDNITPPNTERYGIVLSKPVAEALDNRLSGRLARSSELAFYIKAESVRRALPKPTVPVEKDPLAPASPDWLETVRRDSRPATEHGWTETIAQLSRVASLGRELDAPVVLLYVPTEIEVVHGHWEANAQKLGLDLSEFDIELPIHRLTSESEKLGIHILDLRPALRTDSRGSTYFPVNQHWTALGHSRVAAAISAFLADAALLR